MRFGIEKDEFFMNVGTSFRKPNLYEKFGDSYVSANESLMPEEGTGYEIGFGALSLFLYEFEESIEYMSGFSTADIVKVGEELTYTWTNAMYYNAGSYQAQGIRFDNQWGPFGLLLKYNETDQSRVAEYIIVLDYMQTYKGVDFGATYKGLFDRKPGQYDVLPTGQEYLDDLKVLDLYVVKNFNNGWSISGRLDNVTNEEAEPVPGYGNDGREFYLTLNYNW